MMKEISTGYALLAGFLIFRRHRFLRTEMDKSNRPHFVFAYTAELETDIQEFKGGDPLCPCRTMERILTPLHRSANAMRRKVTHKDSRQCDGGMEERQCRTDQ